MSDRARYLQSLQEERGMVAQRPASAAQQARLAEIDRVLDLYADEPQGRHLETATAATEPEKAAKPSPARRVAARQAKKK